MIVFSYGIGTNGTAALIGMKQRGLRPDVILFADTAGERPHTYAYREIMRDWCKCNGFPDIETVTAGRTTLEEDCIKRKALPSIAYGVKSCSQRFKTQPQEKYLNNYEPAKEVWSTGKKIIKIIGFDADEAGRAQPYSDKKYENSYPLVEWNWGRDECIDAIEKEGLPQPGKSSCFFCPNMRQSEIRELNQQYPELANRAIAMERNADLTVIKGLGRDWSWEELLKNGEMFPFPNRFERMQCTECIG